MSIPKYALAIFAYNIDQSIEACLNSVLRNGLDEHFTIFVLANGCTDNTESIVKILQAKHSHIELVSIKKADKCHAWNKYVHEIAPEVETHFFIDGDVEVTPGSLWKMAQLIHADPRINLVGGVPVVGRDKDAWTSRMYTYGRVSGGLYTMSNEFLQRLKSEGITMPVGFVGEDFLISELAKSLSDFRQFNRPSIHLKIEPKAGFSFRSLSKKRIADYLQYARRLIRYRIRDYELSMLLHRFEYFNGIDLPNSVQDLYNQTKVLPDYYWRGKFTPIDWIAVYKIRRVVSDKTSRFSKIFN
ncbi:glycosyltransferase [Paraglaciecola aquimarina]|uniref:Glycosyltransferase n=1 Tax=Paraglaciecola algarum TaxID=3050085 RepID=A0ABS9D2G0_9ALTE|nr:glycosyltransferase [Paraglaciecola sp. G1-23]MCF2946635.1 glycosyltransferase [Paraglaciecola sp. G1-23]